jgi:hypothetical protein
MLAFLPRFARRAASMTCGGFGLPFIAAEILARRCGSVAID